VKIAGEALPGNREVLVIPKISGVKPGREANLGKSLLGR
jgi:hypothetical protein